MERLVRKAQRGDKNAFMALIEKNQLALYRAAKAILHQMCIRDRSWVVPGWRSMWSRIMYMAPEKP